jgi:hypothetical protein
MAGILLPDGDVRGQPVDAFPEIEVGSSARGRVIPGGPSLAGRGSFVVHRFDGRAGGRYQVEARSDDFDAYLELCNFR